MALIRRYGKIGLGILAVFICMVVLFDGGRSLLSKAGRSVAGYDVIYPQPESHLRFSHAAHGDLDCTRCHSGIDTSGATEDRNLPREGSCRECHQADVRKTVNEIGSEKRCTVCHADYDPAGVQRPSRPYWPKARIKFSHLTHVLRMISCDACHASIKVSEKTGGRHLPEEKKCLECHFQWKQEQRCTRCHESLPSGEMRTSFDGLYLMPQKGNLNHQRNWDERHVKVAQFTRNACRTCHQQRFCDSCHNGVRKPMRIHPEDYATLHPIDARKDRNRCNACHRYQSFCLDCHQKLGVSSTAKRRSRTRIHPDGFGDCVRTLTHHSDQAKRNLGACMSCHTESDCIRCHKGGSGSACGRSINIHGHLSNSQLSRMQKLNPRACRKCHENAAQ